jgi:hypothetical protein
MKTNIFLNPYQQPENKLTYSFLSLLELTNNKLFCEFLSKRQLKENPLTNIKTVFGGGTTNPDGSFDLTDTNGQTFTVYFENKTKRLGLTQYQIENHLEWLNPNDLLLVITPRKSDIEILRTINDNRIIFFTWSEIATQLKLVNEIICNHFVDYGKISGEFEELGELTRNELITYCDYFKSNFDKKIANIISEFYHEVDISKYSLFIPKRQNYEWGRNGVEFIVNDYEYEENKGLSFGQFFTIAYYFNTEDHAIPFKKDEPEICVFFDVQPNKKQILKDDIEFKSMLEELVLNGFESNLNEEISENPWRLFFYRKPLSELQKLSVLTLLEFTDEVFNKIINSKIYGHKYFDEMKTKIYSS